MFWRYRPHEQIGVYRSVGFEINVICVGLYSYADSSLMTDRNAFGSEGCRRARSADAAELHPGTGMSPGHRGGAPGSTSPPDRGTQGSETCHRLVKITYAMLDSIVKKF